MSGAPAVRIPLSAPDLGQAEIDAVTRVLAGGRLALGPEARAFEAELAAAVGARHAAAVSSGTAGLHLGLLALGIGPGDEVITTPFSFVASANAIVYVGARPVFVDVDPCTLALDAGAVERAVGQRTRAILAVHVFGRPLDMPPLLELARRHRLALVEDACEALGARDGGGHAGAQGDAGVFAFYPNKQITTGEGGMVVTGSEGLARTVCRLRNQGRSEAEGLDHVELGYNYRMTEMQAALGRVQLARLPEILDRRAAVAHAYAERLAGEDGLVLPAADPPGGRTSWFVWVVRLAERFSGADRDAVAGGLARRGIACGRYFPPIHLQPYYRRLLGHGPGAFPHTEAAAARTLALPFFNRLTGDQIDEVCDTLTALLRKRGEGLSSRRSPEEDGR